MLILILLATLIELQILYQGVIAILLVYGYGILKELVFMFADNNVSDCTDNLYPVCV
jgi:hypothetical protein